MELETLRQLFVTELKDIYSAEKQLLVALPKMQKNATNPDLKAAFGDHLMETKEQVKRLEQIFNAIGENPEGKTCQVMTAIITEGEQIMNSSGDSDVIDAALIAGAQKAEHIEICSYGTLISHAYDLGDRRTAQLLKESLEEEYSADDKLTALAKGHINEDARNASYNYSGSYSSSSEGGAGSGLAGLLLGAAAGIAAGMLLAPQSGTESRRKVTETANDWKHQLTDRIDNLSDSARSLVKKGKRELENVGSDVADYAKTGTTGSSMGTSTKTSRTTPTTRPGGPSPTARPGGTSPGGTDLGGGPLV
jgi:ferritin-like metal-binding protein YciE/gas vesicle protein